MMQITGINEHSPGGRKWLFLFLQVNAFFSSQVRMEGEREGVSSRPILTGLWIQRQGSVLNGKTGLACLQHVAIFGDM